MKAKRIYRPVLAFLLSLLVLSGNLGFILTLDVCDQCGVHATSLSGIIPVEIGADCEEIHHKVLQENADLLALAESDCCSSCCKEVQVPTPCHHHKQWVIFKLDDQEQGKSQSRLIQPDLVAKTIDYTPSFQEVQTAAFRLRTPPLPDKTIYREVCSFLL